MEIGSFLAHGMSGKSRTAFLSRPELRRSSVLPLGHGELTGRPGPSPDLDPQGSRRDGPAVNGRDCSSLRDRIRGRSSRESAPLPDAVYRTRTESWGIRATFVESSETALAVLGGAMK